MAITNATFQEYKQVGDNSYQVRVRLTDPTLNPTTYDKWLTVSGTTLAELTADASRQIAALNAAGSQKDLLAGIAVNTAIPVTYTPPAAPAPTNEQAWRRNVDRAFNAEKLRALWVANSIAVPALFTSDFTTLLNNLATGTGANGYTSAKGATL